MTDYKLFNYMGSKLRHINIINEYIKMSDKKVYAEPFLGSGCVFLNLEKEFDRYYLCEKDDNVYRLFKNIIENIEVEDFTDYFNDTLKTYQLNQYDDYYSYREMWNNDLWQSDKKEESFGLIMLSCCCINSMFRFGKNGFNQGFGGRFINKEKIDRSEKTIEYIKNKKDRIFLYDNYNKLFELNNALVFLDPPYFKNPLGNGSWDEDKTKYMLDFFNKKNNDIIYTDIDNSHGEALFKNKYKLDIIKNISPNRKGEILLDEVIYSNFYNKEQIKSNKLF